MGNEYREELPLPFITVAAAKNMNMFFAGFYEDPCNNNAVIFQFLFAYRADSFYPVVRGVTVRAAVDFHHTVRISLKEH